MTTMAKKKHKAMAVPICPTHGTPHGVQPRPITFTFDDEPAESGEVVYEDKSSTVGYSKRYSDNWDRVFNKETSN
jgi:hypothetical protein